MADLKHVGRLNTNNRRLVVAYRVIPNDPTNCLVVHTESLDADQHDTLMKTVESNAGQNAYELADVMARTQLPDGRIMLSAFHREGKLVKVPTSSVDMTPNNQTAINLAELNQIIADQKGVTVSDLAVKGPENKEAETVTADEPVTTPVDTQNDVLTDEDLAAKYRSDADRMFKEAKRLREMAEELVPTKKKAKSEM
jgi:hypothetical protein